MTISPPERLISRVFDLLLGREPSASEVAHLLPLVGEAAGALALLEKVTDCPEYRDRTGRLEGESSDFVQLLFQGFLARCPSQAEAEHFAHLRESGARPVDLARRLHDSAEFQARRASNLFVPPGHFYSPVVNTAELKSVIPEVRPCVEVHLPDVSLDLAAMERLWDILLPFLRTTPFTVEKSPQRRYHFDNPAFSFADSMILRAMILHFRPARIVEVGSGFSSACTLDTVFDEARLDCDLTFIEPYPELLRQLMGPVDEARTTIVPQLVQSVPLEVFKRLKANDILFIDSTHVAKTGSDVVHELTNVLPILSPGVIVHFHDIFYPFEYGHDWAIKENRSWNEIYALRAFLAFNSRFQVIFFNDMFGQLRKDLIARTVPDFLRNTGGSIWLRVT